MTPEERQDQWRHETYWDPDVVDPRAPVLSAAPTAPEEKYRRVISGLTRELNDRCAMQEAVFEYAGRLHILLRALADRVEFENEVEGVEIASELLKEVREVLASPLAPNAGTSGAGGDPPAQEPETPTSVPSVPPRAYREEDE